MLDILVRVLLYFFAFLIFLQFVYGANLIYLSYKSLRAKSLKNVKLSSHPTITVQLPLYNEQYVASRIIEAACKLDWPKEKLEIQVLDDSTDKTSAIVAKVVKNKRKQGIDITHIKRTNRDGFKAGALEAGMKKAKGEFIAIFDADFIPKPDFLRQCMPSFSKDVAMVQARWGYVNRNYSLLTKVQAIVLDSHFAIDQEARHASNYFFNFNGTAGVWRKDAIVKSGGWQHDTLTEDLDLTYRAQLAGYKCVYLNDVDVPSEIPANVDGLRLQQQRWAKGNVQCAFKLAGSVLKSKMPLMKKLQALFHLTTYSFQIVAFLVIMLFPLVSYVAATYFSMSLNAPTLILLGTFVAPGIHFMSGQKKLGKYSTRFFDIVATSFIASGLLMNTVYAFASLLFRKVHIFERTPKFGLTNKKSKEKKSKYQLRLSPVFRLEVLFWCYLSASIIYALSVGNWLYVLYSSLFFTGTSAMILYEIKELIVKYYG